MVDLYDQKLLPTAAKDNNNTTYWPPNIDECVAHLDFGTSINEDVGTMSFSASVMGADPRLVSTDSLDIEMLRMRCENNKQNDYKLTFEDDSGQWTTSGIGASFMTNASASPTALQTRKSLRFLRGKECGQASDGSSLLAAYNQGNHGHPSLRLLERLNSADDNKETARGFGRGSSEKRICNEKWRDKLLNEIFNNSNGNASFSQIHQNFGIRKPSIITWGRIGGDFTNATASDSTEKVTLPPAFDNKVNRSVNQNPEIIFGNNSLI